MKTTIYRSDSRGYQYHGWLEARHTFSFADYYDPKRVNFGALRVLNDDIVQGGMGFGMHPHSNMEIITIPLQGCLRHEDNLGSEGLIRMGDVQVMSAGSGIVHSEFNGSKDELVNLFQIWIIPNEKNVEPRYQQKSFNFEKKKNDLQEIVSSIPSENSLWIHQDVSVNIGLFDRNKSYQYDLKNRNHGVFLMVIRGTLEFEGVTLKDRDAIGVEGVDKLIVNSLSDDLMFLLMEVPMK